MSALVLALNPCIDAEWRVTGVRWEEKNTVQSERRWAGGKGINVARWLRFLGGSPKALLPLGGQTGVELAGYLRDEMLPSRIIPLNEPTRVNVVVTTAAGRQLRFNAAGPELSRREWSQVQNSVLAGLNNSMANGRRLLIISGSLPRGVPATAYAKLIRLARRTGVRTLLDCDGEAFAAAVKEGPFLVKPNEYELAQWRGRPLRSEAGIIRAARALSEVTGGWVLVSRGAKPAVLVGRQTQSICFARPPHVAIRNTLGAGDALLAAVARQIQLGTPSHQWLRWGIAVGCAATQCAAGELPGEKIVQGLLRKVRVLPGPG